MLFLSIKFKINLKNPYFDTISKYGFKMNICYVIPSLYESNYVLIF